MRQFSDVHVASSPTAMLCATSSKYTRIRASLAVHSRESSEEGSSKLQTEIFSKAPILHVLCCVSVDGSHTFMRISWAVWCVFLYVSLCSASALERSSTITLLMGGWVVVGGWEAEGEGRWEWGKVLCRVESGVSNVHTGTFSMHTHLAAHTKQHTHINMDTSTRHTHINMHTNSPGNSAQQIAVFIPSGKYFGNHFHPWYTRPGDAPVTASAAIERLKNEARSPLVMSTTIFQLLVAGAFCGVSLWTNRARSSPSGDQMRRPHGSMLFVRSTFRLSDGHPRSGVLSEAVPPWVFELVGFGGLPDAAQCLTGRTRFDCRLLVRQRAWKFRELHGLAAGIAAAVVHPTVSPRRCFGILASACFDDTAGFYSTPWLAFAAPATVIVVSYCHMCCLARPRKPSTRDPKSPILEQS